MNKNRLEAFSDGVLAIIITIMVLELKIPESEDWSELWHLFPLFISYILSFTFVGIYWGNHHHLLHTVKRVSSGIIWSNMNLLFWLSLVPFATGWLGKTNFSQHAVIVYAVELMLCGMSYYILQKTIQARHKADVDIKKMLAAQERKGMASLVLYLLAIVFAFFNTMVSGVLFFVVAIMWLVPDRNIERILEGEE